MANEEHVEILKQGVEVWNEWRQVNSGIRPDLRSIDLEGVCLSFIDFSFADLTDVKLSQANFYRANFSRAFLSGANFTGANLKEANLNRVLSVGTNFQLADFRGANLSESDFSMSDFVEAVMKSTNFNRTILHGADFSYADLSNATLDRADLNEVNFSGANLSNALLSFTDLSKADLQGTKLQEADLQGANLSGLDLRQLNIWDVNFSDAILSNVNMSGLDISRHHLGGADLSYANLIRTIALATDFQDAILTGACIEDWHINSNTNLNNINCDYIYLQYPRQERRPHNGNFKPGEFTKIFQKVRETADLIFSNGIDWVAFLNSFQKLQVQCDSDELFIQAFENKGDAFVVRVSVPLGADKAKFEKLVKRQYELEAQLEAQKELTEANYRHYTDLKEIVKLLAGRTINVEARAVAESQSMSGANQPKYDQRGANIGSNVDTARDNARVQAIQHNYAPEPKQTLAEAAAEIQQLLEQLERANPSATEADQTAFLTAVIPPTKRVRFANALREGGKELFKELMDNIYFNVAIAAIEGWHSAE